jgi:hypothetical protein
VTAATSPDTPAWAMWRAWTLLMGVEGVDAARSRKILHHKRPAAFPYSTTSGEIARQHRRRSTTTWGPRARHGTSSRPTSPASSPGGASQHLLAFVCTTSCYGLGRQSVGRLHTSTVARRWPPRHIRTQSSRVDRVPEPGDGPFSSHGYWFGLQVQSTSWSSCQLGSTALRWRCGPVRPVHGQP